MHVHSGYNAWGSVNHQYPIPTNSDSYLKFGFNARWGYVTDASTGLNYCQNRYYDPATGRFLTRDPIGYEGGANLYGYCGGNPVLNADPSGLILPVLAVVVAVIEFIETPLDVALTVIDAIAFYKNPCEETALWLAVDLGFLALPGIPNITGIRHLAKLKRVSQVAETTVETAQKVAPVTLNRLKGLAAEEKFLDRATSLGLDIRREKSCDTALGLRKSDFGWYSNGVLKKRIEIKSGSAVYGGKQMAKDDIILQETGVPTKVIRMP